MVRTTLTALTVFTIGALAACGASSTSTSPTPAPAQTPIPTPTPTPAPSETAVPTALDPCQLVPASEASSLAGATFGPGVESSHGNGKYCTYGAQTTNVFMVIVAQAPDQATLDAEKADAIAALSQVASKSGVTTTMLPIADGAAYLSGKGELSGVTLSVSAIYVIKGLTFFGFSDALVPHAAPSSAAMQAEAQTVLTRVP